MNIYNVALIKLSHYQNERLIKWTTESDYEKTKYCPFDGNCKTICCEMFNIYTEISNTIGKCPCYLFGVKEITRIVNLWIQYNNNFDMDPNIEIIEENCGEICKIFLLLKIRERNIKCTQT